MTAWELASFSPDVLRVDSTAIAELAGAEDALDGVEVDVVGPGDSVRLTHVLDAVEPRIRTEGRTNAIAGAAVIACLDFPGEERPLHEQEGLIDLAGPAAALTPFAELTNVVLTFRPKDDAGHVAIDEAARRVTLATAELVAEGTRDGDPEQVERFELGPAADDLPRIAALVQLSDLGSLYTQWVDGVAAGEAGLPAVVEPWRLLDTLVVCGEYHWAALRNPTIFLQRNELVRALYREHGERLAFAGLVLMRGYEQSADDKWAAAKAAAALAHGLSADGAIITTDAGGNSHTDVMLTVRACEQAGVRTAVIVAEMADPDSTNPGLTDWVPEADCIVSAGNAEELVSAWAPDRVLGGDRLLDGTPAAEATPIPVRNYLGATNQMGQLSLTATTW